MPQGYLLVTVISSAVRFFTHTMEMETPNLRISLIDHYDR